MQYCTETGIEWKLEIRMKNYWIIGGGATLGLLFIASVVVTFTQDEASFNPGSPEAVVQDYLNALDSEDFESAYQALSPELRAECAVDEMFGGRIAWNQDVIDGRITLEDTQELGDTTFVTVKIARLSGGGLFGPSEYDFEERFALKQFDGRWKFSQEPWPFPGCARGDLIPTPPTRQPNNS